MTEKRGRPKKSTNTIHVNDLLCEYTSLKTDKFNNAIIWYKIVDPNYKQKMSSILSQICDECKMPFFKTDDNMFMLKVKTKYDKTDLNDSVDDTTFRNIVFKYYCMETADGLLQGYYVQKIETNEEKENKN